MWYIRYNFVNIIFFSLVDGRSDFAVAASITELLKDLPQSLIQGGDRKSDSNRSSFGEETQQQVLKSTEMIL